jgi:hypothetical protein
MIDVIARISVQGSSTQIEGDGIWADPLAGVQVSDRGEIFCGELEAKDVEVDLERNPAIARFPTGWWSD